MDLRDFISKVIKKKGGATKLSDIVQASYPAFKERIAQAPGMALDQLAEYERENPAGTVNQAMVGGIGALGFGAASKAGRVFKGIEGAPKFEFSDAGATLGELPKALKTARLGDVLDHPELYNQYPDLAELKIKKQIPSPFNAGEKGEFNPSAGEITIQAGNEAKSSLLHEIQHAIQEKEGFASGGSPTNFYGLGDSLNASKQIEELMDNLRFRLRDRKSIDEALKKIEELKELQKLPSEEAKYQKYRRLGGEVESRNVEGRMNMTDAERQATPFTSTYDVPIEQQIIRRRSAPASLQDFMSEYNRMKS